MYHILFQDKSRSSRWLLVTDEQFDTASLATELSLLEARHPSWNFKPRLIPGTDITYAS